MTYEDPRTGRERNLGQDDVGSSVWSWISGFVIVAAIALGVWYYYDHNQTTANVNQPSPSAAANNTATPSAAPGMQAAPGSTNGPAVNSPPSNSSTGSSSGTSGESSSTSSPGAPENSTTQPVAGFNWRKGCARQHERAGRKYPQTAMSAIHVPQRARSQRGLFFAHAFELRMRPNTTGL